MTQERKRKAKDEEGGDEDDKKDKDKKKEEKKNEEKKKKGEKQNEEQKRGDKKNDENKDAEKQSVGTDTSLSASIRKQLDRLVDVMVFREEFGDELRDLGEYWTHGLQFVTNDDAQEYGEAIKIYLEGRGVFLKALQCAGIDGKGVDVFFNKVIEANVSSFAILKHMNKLSEEAAAAVVRKLESISTQRLPVLVVGTRRLGEHFPQQLEAKFSVKRE